LETLVSLCLLVFLLSGVASADISGTALIVDGDTIAISGMKVRLSGIDTERKIKPVEKPVSHGVVVMKPLKL
jgi:endonuclease YncB( thermonuclease family)